MVDSIKQAKQFDIIILSTQHMAEEQFQIIMTNDDYTKLQHHEAENKKLVTENKKLTDQIITLNKKIKDLTRAVYVRDSFIDYVASESDYAFSNILSLDIVSCDITQSLYQDVVSHEQNGISSIELREAMDVYISKNKRIFQRLNQLQDKFMELKYKIAQLESTKKTHVPQQKEEPPKKVELPKKEDFPSLLTDPDLNGFNKQLEKQKATLARIQGELNKLQTQKEKLRKQNEEATKKNTKLNKDNEALGKKLETQGQKSYIIKLMVDEYYNEVERNLLKIGGLSKTQIGTVVANQMKGIVYYIENLSKKAKK